MPTVTARDIVVQQLEADARVKIAEVLHAATLTTIQAVHLLATLLADYTRRLEAQEAKTLDAAPRCALDPEVRALAESILDPVGEEFEPFVKVLQPLARAYLSMCPDFAAGPRTTRSARR